MHRIVNLIAPKGWADGLWKGAILLVLMIATNYLINGPLRGYQVNIGSFIFNTSAVALPFLALAMTLLWHQRKLQEQLLKLAATDMLTGLPNRRAYFEQVAASLAGPGASPRRDTMLMIDADHFKHLNDTYGHAFGDTCLRALADHLRSCLREDDLVGRIGGEEFSILLRGTDADHLQSIGQRLCAGVTVTARPGGPPVHLTLSAGAAETCAKNPLDTALTRADQALYVAKLRGRRQLVVWPDGVRDDGVRDQASPSARAS